MFPSLAIRVQPFANCNFLQRFAKHQPTKMAPAGEPKGTCLCQNLFCRNLATMRLSFGWDYNVLAFVAKALKTVAYDCRAVFRSQHHLIPHVLRMAGKNRFPKLGSKQLVNVHAELKEALAYVVCWRRLSFFPRCDAGGVEFQLGSELGRVTFGTREKFIDVHAINITKNCLEFNKIQRKTKIIIKHIIPQTLSYAIVAMTLSVPSYILAESGLSFLGLGIQQPDASWGNMLKEAQEYINILYRPWLLTPGFLIFIAVLCFNLLGDTLRDILDPKNNNR